MSDLSEPGRPRRPDAIGAPSAPPGAGARGEIFGHPTGLAFIVAVEAFWSFAYYGMVTLLTLYMTRQLFTPGHMEHVLGFGQYRATLEGVFGPMTPLAIASQTFGLATGMIYALPILGGLVADRWLGQRRTVVLGLIVQTAGHLLLVTEAGFLFALVLLILGAGLVKSNLLGQLGRLYGTGDARRTRGFGLFLIAVNIGGFITPLVCGTLGEKVGWRYGLMAAAVSMLLALVAYIAGLRHFPPDSVRAPATSRDPVSKPRLQTGETKIVVAILFVLVGGMLNTGTYNQAFNIFPVWAQAHIDLNLMGFQMPVTWFSALDGVLTILGTALAIRLWAWQAHQGREPSEVTRIATGCAMTATAFLILAGASAAAGAGKAPILAGAAFFLFADFAIPWVDTITMALISRAAPPKLNSTMLGVYFLFFAGGNFLVGWLGHFYEILTPAAFWLLHASIGGGAALYLLAARRRLTAALGLGAH